MCSYVNYDLLTHDLLTHDLLTHDLLTANNVTNLVGRRVSDKFLGYVIVTAQKCIPIETSAPPYILRKRTALSKIHTVFEYHILYSTPTISY